MNVVLFVILPVAGIVLGWIIRWLYAKFQLSSAEQKAERVKQDALKEADCVPLKTIEELRDMAYSIVGEPDPVQFGDRVVGIIEGRDGTIMDVVRQVKTFEF